MAADEFVVNVDPAGNLAVGAKLVNVVETNNCIIEKTDVGLFFEGTRVATDDPTTITAGATITSVTDL